MSQAARIRELIKQNFTPGGEKRLSWVELADKNNIPIKNLQAQVSVLRRAGLLPETKEQQLKRFHQAEAWRKRTGVAPRNSATLPREVVEPQPDALDGITSLSGAMPRDERVKQLSNIARNGSELGQIKAMQSLEEMERAAGTSYGPPPPTTKNDTVVLLLELLKSTKRDWALAAIEAYQNEQAQEQDSQKQEESSGTADSTGDLGGRGA